MKRFLTILALLAMATACGQENHGSTLSSASPMQAASLCTGGPDPATITYRVTAYSSTGPAFVRVTLEMQSILPSGSAPRVIGDFTYYENLTPAAPTDVQFRWRFKDPNVVDAGYAVTLSNGGFTDRTTASITRDSLAGSVQVASLTCSPVKG